MKIAYIIPCFPLPSETFVYREVAGLIAMGHQIDVISLARPTDEQRQKMSAAMRDLAAKTRYLEREDLLRSAFNLAMQPKAALINWRLSRCATQRPNGLLRLLRGLAVSRLIRQGGYQRMHAHWPYAHQVAAVAHSGCDLPFSISVHAHEVEHDAGHFPLLFERIDLAAFCNEAGMRRLLAKLGADCAARCHLLYHGVNLDQFQVSSPPTVPPLRLITTGRLTVTKGQQRLIDALAHMRRKQLDVELVIVGDGTLRAQLETQIESLGLSDRVRITGWIPHDQVQIELAKSHLFVLLADTNYHDGLPNAVLEALAIGRGAILSPLPAATEAIVEGHNGFVLDSTTAYDQLSTILGDLLAAPARLEQLGQAARRLVAERFDETHHLRRFADLMQGTVETANDVRAATVIAAPNSSEPGADSRPQAGVRS